MRKPTIHGCRVIALDHEDRILLIRQSYGPRHWLAPGGSIDRGEDPVQTAHRELGEETGCTLTGAGKVAELIERPMGAYNVVHVVVGRAGGVLKADNREVDAADWFALDALPQDTGRHIREGLAGWITAWRAAHSNES